MAKFWPSQLLIVTSISAIMTRIFQILAISTTLAVIILSLRPSLPSVEVPNSDKLMHFLAYGVLAGLTPSRVASPLGRPYRHRVHWSGRRARIWPIPNGSRSNGLYSRRLRQFSGRDPRCNPLSYLSSPQIQLIRSLPCAN